MIAICKSNVCHSVYKPTSFIVTYVIVGSIQAISVLSTVVLICTIILHCTLKLQKGGPHGRVVKSTDISLPHLTIRSSHCGVWCGFEPDTGQM